jgi:hypothetical protein
MCARARGGVLLELLLAIALFVMAASFTLSSLRSALDSMRRADLRARAYDAAASRLAELDAGLLAVGDLGDELPVGGDLGVTVEIEPSPGSALMRARAVVRTRTEGEEADSVVVAELERWIEQRERGSGDGR